MSSPYSKCVRCSQQGVESCKTLSNKILQCLTDPQLPQTVVVVVVHTVIVCLFVVAVCNVGHRLVTGSQESTLI